MTWLVVAAACAILLARSVSRGSDSSPLILPVPGSMPPSGGSPAGASAPHPITVMAILAAGAMVAFAISGRPSPGPSPGPAPAPQPDGWPAIDLRGAFVGETAAEDAATTQYLLQSLSEVIAYDGTLREPRLKTAAAFDDLRVSARDYRMKGGTLGSRQPLARDRIEKFLDQSVGTAGGPVDADGRKRFVRAFSDISKAASAAIGR